MAGRQEQRLCRHRRVGRAARRTSVGGEARDQRSRQPVFVRRRRDEARPQLCPQPRLREAPAPPLPPPLQRPQRHAGHRHRRPRRQRDCLGDHRGHQHHRLQVDPPTQKAQRRRQRPPPAPPPPAAQRVAQRERLTGHGHQSSPGLPLVIPTVQRPFAVPAPPCRYRRRDRLVHLLEPRKDLPCQAKCVQHRPPPCLSNPEASPLRGFLQVS